MRRTMRSVITWLAFLALTAVSLGSVVQVITGKHEDRATTDRQQMFEALVSGDLGQTSVDTKRRFVRRLELDFRDRFDWNALLARVEPDRQKQVMENWNELTRTWLADKLEEYFNRSERRRTLYLEQEIDHLLAWRMPVDASSETGQTLRLEPVNIATLKAQADQWLTQATPKRREQLERLAGDVQRLFFTRQFRSLLPGQK